MATTPIAKRHVLPLEAWPESDQLRWQAATSRGRSLKGDKHAATLRPYTVRNACRGFGCFLAFLRDTGALDTASPPTARVTPERVTAFVAHLQARGNMDNTIATRLWDLRTALRILAPEVDFGWMTSPDGVAIRALLPQVPRVIEIHHSLDLYNWGMARMDAALALSDPIRRATRYRDGLIIALLAARGPRIESIWRMRLGQHLLPHGDGYRVAFRREDMKTKRPHEYILPATLTPRIDHYVQVEREVLGAGRDHDWLWLNENGERFGKAGMAGMIRRVTEARFGKAFGTHRFRHGAGTIGPLAAPGSPAATAAMLGASAAVIEDHYNRGNQQLAAGEFHAALLRERAAVAGLGARLLAKRGGR